MHASQSESGMGDQVWQGYVSAVACLLLSLLLLMCILALAMIALGGEKAASAPQAEPVVAPAPVADVAPKSAAPQQEAQWALQFPDNTVEIRPQDYAALAKRLGLPEPSAGTQWRWSIWCLANPESQSSQRLAYLRLLSVRELLIQQGLQPDHINIEIRPPGPTNATANETLVLVKRTLAKAPITGGNANGSP